MVEESEPQKLKSKYPEFFAQFSPKFLEFIFSKETSTGIARICLESDIKNEGTVEKIAYRVTLALLDQVPKENLPKILEKGAGLSRQVAEKISFAVKQRIFSQAPTTQPMKSPPPIESEVAPPPEAKPEIEKKEGEKDVYREPIE